MGPIQQHDGRQNLVSLSKFWIRWGEFCSRKLTAILFYVRDIPLSTRTISEYNLIKWCRWDHLLDRILMGLRVRAAGLKVFMVSIDDLVCQLCIGCSLSLSNNGTKLCVITDIFVLSYSFWLVQWDSQKKRISYDFHSYICSTRHIPKTFHSAALSTATQPWWSADRPSQRRHGFISSRPGNPKIPIGSK
jgi:hypothetical protein